VDNTVIEAAVCRSRARKLAGLKTLTQVVYALQALSFACRVTA
jgi:hypothetical protein